MLDTGGEHHSLARPAKQLVGLVHPLVNYVTGNLHTALGGLVLRPFTGNLLDSGHVDLFGYEDLERDQPFVLNQLTRWLGSDYMAVGSSEAICERRSGQADNPHLRVTLDELNHLLTLDMTLVNDQEADIGEVRPPLKSLCAADLYSLIRPVSPVP